MILGMTTLTFIHVVLSLIGIVAGFVAMAGLLASQRRDGWTAIFLAATVATSVTGFLFPVSKLLPSHIVGIVSLVILAVALYALYGRHLSGVWRPVYVVTAMIALYLNVFVLIIQSFLKIAPLNALAPTQSELPFVIAQGAALLFFVIVTIVAAMRFRPSVARMV
ncbi:MAG: hypothetical protein BGP05_07970 [Rhizobiales bacterium 62-47]|nr:hypothetical protein [Hyphomicrobiales bacterium]OJY14234.1 MAG: hypothetical protein BGP05_07970 [Rhizobiales bacterium 62-47]